MSRFALRESIFRSHCFAHKIQLSVNHGMRSIREVQFLEEKLQSIHVFFSNKGF